MKAGLGRRIELIAVGELLIEILPVLRCLHARRGLFARCELRLGGEPRRIERGGEAAGRGEDEADRGALLARHARAQVDGLARHDLERRRRLARERVAHRESRLPARGLRERDAHPAALVARLLPCRDRLARDGAVDAVVAHARADPLVARRVAAQGVGRARALPAAFAEVGDIGERRARCRRGDVAHVLRELDELRAAREGCGERERAGALPRVGDAHVGRRRPALVLRQVRELVGAQRERARRGGVGVRERERAPVVEDEEVRLVGGRAREIERDVIRRIARRRDVAQEDFLRAILVRDIDPGRVEEEARRRGAAALVLDHDAHVREVVPLGEALERGGEVAAVVRVAHRGIEEDLARLTPRAVVVVAHDEEVVDGAFLGREAREREAHRGALELLVRERPVDGEAGEFHRVARRPEHGADGDALPCRIRLGLRRARDLRARRDIRRFGRCRRGDRNRGGTRKQLPRGIEERGRLGWRGCGSRCRVGGWRGSNLWRRSDGRSFVRRRLLRCGWCGRLLRHRRLIRSSSIGRHNRCQCLAWRCLRDRIECGRIESCAWRRIGHVAYRDRR